MGAMPVSEALAELTDLGAMAAAVVAGGGICAGNFDKRPSFPRARLGLSGSRLRVLPRKAETLRGRNSPAVYG